LEEEDEERKKMWLAIWQLSGSKSVRLQCFITPLAWACCLS